MEDIECESCNKFFKNQILLIKHQTTICKKLQNIVHICTKCDFYSNGLKKIETHDCNNDVNNEKIINPFDKYNKIITKLKDEINIYKIRSYTLEDQNDLLKNNKIELTIEKIKNNIYKQIIEQKTNIVIDDIFDYKEDGLHIYNDDFFISIHNCKNENINIINKPKKVNIEKNKSTKKKETEIINKSKKVNTEIINKSKKKKETENNTEIINKPKKVNIEITNKSKKKKETDNNIEITNKSNKNKEVKDDNPEIKQNNSDKKIIFRGIKNSIEEIDTEKQYENNMEKSNTIINNCFEVSKKSRICLKSIDIIKEIRNRFFISGKMNLEEYIDYVNNHIIKFREIFSTKDFTDRKFIDTLLRCLTPIESRFLMIENFNKGLISIDDQQLLQKTLFTYSDNNNKDFFSFEKNKEKIFLQFNNYSSLLFPLKHNLERILVNKNGFNNIIYIDNPKSSELDPYSFYIFIEYNKDYKRTWKMDCRLKEFSTDFVTHMKSYFITSFRKIYFSIYSDNDYRSTYTQKHQILEFDCDQIICNLMIVKNSIHFSHILRQLIKEKSKHIATTKDKVNLSADDIMLRKEFQSYKNDIKDDIELIKELFDKISEEDSTIIYNRICTL